MGSKFVDDAIAAHNAYRSKHKVSPLTKAKDLCDFAQKWADNIAKSGNFRHSDCMHKGERLGENIAMKYTSSGDPFTGQQVTDQWYSEVAKYTFGSDFSSGTGHFTQVVWKGSKEVGLGQAKAKDGKIFVVASYRPAGNMMGQFKENVFKPDGPIVLPKKEEPKPMTFRSFGGDGSPGDSGMTRITHSMPSSTSTQRVVRTVTNQSGPQTVSRMVVTETKTGPNGETITVTKETVNGKETTTTKVSKKGELERLKNLHLDEDVTGKKYLPTNAWESSNNHVPAKPKPCKQTSTEFIDDCVRAHNNLRSRHGVPPLKHNADLSAHAQKWAEYLAASNVMKHSKNDFKGTKPGENIATKWSSGVDAYTGKEAVAQWYSEINKYDFRTATHCLTAGHFTQVVWKGSKEIGVGRAVGQDGRVYVVANYLPPGNVLGNFKENVLPSRHV